MQLGADSRDCDLFFLLCVARQLCKMRLLSLLFFLVFGVDGSVVPNHVMRGHICLFPHGPQFVCVFFLHEQHLFSQLVADCVVCQIYFALVSCDLRTMLPTFYVASSSIAASCLL